MASQSPYLTVEGPAGVRIEVHSIPLGEVALRFFFAQPFGDGHTIDDQKAKIQESSLGDINIIDNMKAKVQESPTVMAYAPSTT